MLVELRKMLHEAFVARATGATHPKMTRAHGYVDGYMRALLETGAASKDELLAIVAEERAIVAGPSTGTVEADTAAA